MRYVFAGLLASCLLLPAPSLAGLFCPHSVNPCQACNPCVRCRPNPCQCRQHVRAVPQVTMVPRVHTTPTVSYRDVVRTEYRLQPEVKTVPVTRMKTVTVDEGAWQKIWVPKLVAKQVSETVYQQQTSYRQVPYQVTQRVPQVSYTQTTQLVPTVTGQTTTACSTCGPTTTWNSAGTMAAYPYPVLGATTGLPVIASPPVVAAAQPVVPQVATRPTRQPIQLGREIEPLDDAVTGSDLNPVPDPQFLDIPQAAYSDSTPVRSTSRRSSAQANAASGLFVPAPSAAAVWRSRSSRN